MQTQVQHTASGLKSLHLLRSLLREASYLPDAHARQYFRRYIVGRFRAYQPKQDASPSRDVETYRRSTFKHRRHQSIIDFRSRATQRKAQKGLHYLRRANQGELPCLEKVLHFAYGRLGRGRYALLERLLAPDPPGMGAEGLVDTATEPPLHKLYYSNQRCLSFFATPVKHTNTQYKIEILDRFSRLKAVVKSQASNRIALNRALKKPHLITPIKNTWERPMPIKRARNNVKRWYAETMDRLLPPLPNELWDDVDAMIKGEKGMSFVQRRKPAVQQEHENAGPNQHFLNTVKAAIALDKPSKADKPRGNQRPHTINSSFMRRMYTKVLALCCKLEWDEKRYAWNVIWGQSSKSINPRIYFAPVDQALFAGVDLEGQLIKPPKPKQETKTKVETRPKVERQRGFRTPFFVDYLPKDHPVRVEAENIRRQRRAQSALQDEEGGEPSRT